MRSSFFEFHVARTGIFSSRGALEVIGHNITNAQTPGFSRQYVEQRATSPLTYNNGRGMVGTGSEIYGIGQYRDFYLDTKYWKESSVLGEYSAKYTQLSIIESMMNGLSATGTTSCFDDFFNTLQSLNGTAGDDTYRMSVIKAGETLSTFIRSQVESLKKQQTDINEEVKTVVQRINSLGQQIRSLNEQITKYELDGSKANDLRDARASLVDELSRYVNIEVEEIEQNADYAAGKYPEPEDRGRSNKLFVVKINGYDFVTGDSIQTLRVVARDQKQDVEPFSQAKKNPMDVSGLYDIYFANSGVKFNIYSESLQGQLKGLIDVRDGNNAYYFQGDNIQSASNTNGTYTLTMDANAAMRLDLNGGSHEGIIVLTDQYGKKTEWTYTNYTYDPATGKATFDVDPGKGPSKQTFPTSLSGYTASVGQTNDYKGIPHYIDKLNEMVRTFALAINEGKNRLGEQIEGVKGHINGYSTMGETDPLGTLFFTYDTKVTNGAIANYYFMNCENFMVNPELMKNPKLLAASSGETEGIDANEVIKGFLLINNYKSLFREGKISDYIIGISSELGIDVNQAKKFEKSYTDVTATINNQRLSVSGVDITEEFSNMILYNQIFHAASKLINIIDGIYDTTINRMGV